MQVNVFFTRRGFNLYKHSHSPVAHLDLFPNMYNVKYKCDIYQAKIVLLVEGYGKSPDSEALKSDQNRVDLLSRFMESLGVRGAVLLSPSMSGHYSIPFLVKNHAQLHGFIPIAPVGTRSYTAQQYQGIPVSSSYSFIISY